MDNILKISEAASMALHAIAFLADQPKEQVANKDIAAALQVSETHLSKVMQRLAKAGLVSSNRGPHGGFRLARAADQVTLLEVYEAIEGPLPSGYCLIGSPVCDGDKCILGHLLKDLNREVRSYLENTRLADVRNIFGKGKKACAS